MIGEFFFISRKIRKKICRIFSDENALVLDLGAGENPKYQKCMKGSIVGFDIRRTQKTKVLGDGNKLPFKGNSFNKIISVNSFYYLENPFDVAGDLNRILKKNGQLVMVMPFYYPVHDAPFDNYRFTEYGIRKMLGKNFKIKEITAVGGVFNIPAIIMHSLIKGVPLLFKGFLKKIALLVYLLYPLYLIAQLVSLLDIFDRTKRFPTYYFVVAAKI